MSVLWQLFRVFRPTWCLVACWCLLGDAYAEEEVRISLYRDQEQVGISGRGLSVFDGEKGRVLASWKGLKQAILRPQSGWVAVFHRGRRLARAQQVFIEARETVSVRKRAYQGRIEVFASESGLDLQNRLPLETYLLGIVGSEMNVEWPIEALKAQAVAARTYAMHRRLTMRAANKPYDLESSVISQVYTGTSRITPRVVEAVKTTRGVVLAFQHDLVEALFHSTCGGRTNAADTVFSRPVRYLKPRRCEWCQGSRFYRWVVDVPMREASRLIEASRLLRGRMVDMERAPGEEKVSLVYRRIERNKSRRQTVVGTKKLRPSTVRRALGYRRVPSNRFSVEKKGAILRFRGRGFGHGVGMCQWGAFGMAKEGRSFADILSHYYRGAELKRLY